MHVLNLHCYQKQFLLIKFAVSGSPSGKIIFFSFQSFQKNYNQENKTKVEVSSWSIKWRENFKFFLHCIMQLICVKQNDDERTSTQYSSHVQVHEESLTINNYPLLDTTRSLQPFVFDIWSNEIKYMYLNLLILLSCCCFSLEGGLGWGVEGVWLAWSIRPLLFYFLTWIDTVRE